MHNLTHWRLLVAIADSASITRAAEHMGITQSGASQALSQLESHLGLPLFARARQQLSLTAFGEEVLAHARRMLQELDAIRALAANNLGLGSGRIRLGSFPSVIAHVLPDLLHSFAQRYPGIEVVAVEGTDEEVLDWLAQGTVDLGVVLNPKRTQHALILGRDQWRVLLSHSHPLARRALAQGVALKEMVDLPFILATGGCSVHAQSLMQQAGLELNNIRLSVKDWTSASVLVREGLGVAILPESTLPADMQQLRALPLAPVIQRKFALVRSQAAAQSSVVQAFWQHIASRLPPLSSLNPPPT
ncbi:LysR family transcriptional regulator [Pseudomonas sp. 5P_3.1_Bac2]|uniref:LysR family transcriptional regulator n=1 Tax=Pseudomonas sp. 5P_3.1_Bac2 TaxID=2971617 RepID=UPI0021C66CB4|nr:LysR family transcriptional regulator [Pseudomonas sp. 5P_3.1_Bac2]MCU1719582.1 LysR family transcriptional regulator [Pseudomonas sp. 5P_3.1_Bac2]